MPPDRLRVKRLLSLLALPALLSVAEAQVTCQTYGNTTNCNGPLGSAIAPVPFVNFGAQQAQQAAAQAQAQALEAQAQLARAQTEALRRQNAAMARQEFFRRINAASDDELSAAASKYKNPDCGWSSECKENAAFAAQAIDDEIQRRYGVFMSCLKRFGPSKSEGEAAGISAVCKQNPSAAPPPPPQPASATGTAVTETPASAVTPFLKKMRALDDALESGAITRAEYNRKVSALLQTR